MSADSRDGTGGPDGRREAQPAGADFIIPLLAVGLTLYYIVSTAELTWEARSTGWLVGFALLVLCAIQFGWLAIQRRRDEITFELGDLFTNTVNNRKRWGLLATLALFVLAIPVTGTTLGLFLVMAGGMMVMGVRRPAQIIGIAACTAGTVFLLFIVLLKSRLPRGALDEALVSLIKGWGG